MVGSIQQVDTPADEFVLTYDDGPDPRHTTSILNVLSDHGATATFFVLLTKVRRAPALLAEVAAAGHEIALHGIDHQRLTSMRPREVWARTKAGRAELEDQLGKEVRWMRPPYGAQTLATWAAIRRTGLTPVVWSGTLWDWKDVPHQQRIDKAMSSARPGVILLGHDSFPGPSDGAQLRAEPRVDRARLAGDVLSAYAGAGLRGRSLSGALGNGEAEKWAWFSR